MECKASIENTQAGEKIKLVKGLPGKPGESEFDLQNSH